MSVIDQLLNDIQIPRLIKVKQCFDRPIITDLTVVLVQKIQAQNVLSTIKPGQSIAIGVGSRGISNLPLMVKILVDLVKEVQGIPFIFPAMGSHGGATADGQESMLERMGITEKYIGAPIRATMEVVTIGKSENGLPVYLDKYAHEADGIIIINRIKPHVAFRGPYESGLLKMITIGLGKQKGAEICHELGFGDMAENIPAIARVTLAKSKIIFGVGILENAYHETCRVEVLKNEAIYPSEPELQKEAKLLSPKLYLGAFDVLIIDEIGKDISGTGFDTNVVGRYHTPYITGDGHSIKRIVVLDLSEKSHGNANGLGIADFTTKRVFDKFDFEQTYPNSLTSTVTLSVKIPMVLKNDRQAIQAALKTCNQLDKSKITLVRIKNTLCLEEIEASENLLAEVENHKCMEAVGKSYELKFDDYGNLL